MKERQLESKLKIENAFEHEVGIGLESNPKTLPSKYFYDAKGDELFQRIMRCEDYYPTRCEFEILSEQSQSILSGLNLTSNELDVIELGAGDGHKTKELLKGFLNANLDIRYRPIDISPNAIDLISKTMESSLPGLMVQGLAGDYFEMLFGLKSESKRPILVLFLGSNIGNMNNEKSIDFLSQLAMNLSPKDHLLVGFDLIKNPETIRRAYNDSGGYTRQFNLNLLTRINRELGGNFNVEKFLHWPVYDVQKGEARSYIVSRKKQQVYIEALDTEFSFDAWETIHTEISRKYSTELIEEMANKSGFKVNATYLDKHAYFADVLMKLS
jgi:L-histidine Nalpha-methyltransferase